jgi:dehydrogenase/reductase SDR family member 7B
MLKDKVVIITGASSGIGEACAKTFAARNCKVVIAARQEDQLKKLADELNASGKKCIAVKTDVSNEMDCKNLIEQTVENFGGVDVLINNAGISMRALFADVDLDVLRKLMNVNFWGTVYCTKYALPHILKNKGTVAGISSIAGYKGLPGRTGYSASKFAMQGFLESLRIENLKKDLNVLIVCPGYTRSNIRNTALNSSGSQQGDTPLDESKLMSAEKVADEIANAVERRKRTLLLTVQGKMTVLINKFFPAFIDRQVYKLVSKEPGSPFK